MTRERDERPIVTIGSAGGRLRFRGTFGPEASGLHPGFTPSQGRHAICVARLTVEPPGSSGVSLQTSRFADPKLYE
jgi:hypothetical protein